jgi:hypothetical protein
MFEKQGWHFFFLVLLLVGIVFFAQGDVLSGQLWGIGTQTWLWVAIAVPVIHQIFVWLFWRLELHYGLITRWLGQSGFPASSPSCYLEFPITTRWHARQR